MDKATDDAYGRTTGQLNTENRIRLMRQELDALRDKVATERVKFDDKQTQFMPVAHTYEMTPRYVLPAATLLHCACPHSPPAPAPLGTRSTRTTRAGCCSWSCRCRSTS